MRKALKVIWHGLSLVCVLFTVTSMLPVPVVDHNGATLVARDRTAQIATARALAIAIGDPSVTLDTQDLNRFLFSDGTSVDSLVHEPNFRPMYSIVALKSVVLGLFSSDKPMDVALRMVRSLANDGYGTSETYQMPDRAFPMGATVLVLSNAWQVTPDAGYAVIIRKHAFRVGGQRPKPFFQTGWPDQAR